jgi:putative ABC transport system substrate-binding protein
MIRRREFIAGISAAGWPVAVKAQQPAVPVVGVLAGGIRSGSSSSASFDAFGKGLSEMGYVEGRDVLIESHVTDQYDQLPALAAELVQRRVAVIFAGGPPAVRAAKAQTANIPIIFIVGEDPVKEGLVPSLNRPGGNVTGFSTFVNQLIGKRLALLRDTLPATEVLGLLVNPTNPNADPDTRDTRAAAEALGRQLHVVTASTERDFGSAFTAILQRRVGALVVGVDPFFLLRRDQIVALAARHSIPAMYTRREFAEAGGLMSYGANYAEINHQAGIYTGRILKGEKPIDLPVQQATKLEFVLNLKTAKALGLEIPNSVVAITDEVIE